MSSVPHKRCIACEQEKPATEFYIVDKATGRLSSRCKPCRIVQVGTYKRSHRAENKGWSKRYRERHADRLKAEYSPEKRKQRYARERSENIAAARRWRRQNPSLKLAQKQRRRARIKANGGVFTAAEWDALKLAQQGMCLRCRKCEPDIQLVPDHVVPISKSGTNDISNIQALCIACNNWKRARTIDYRTAQM